MKTLLATAISAMFISGAACAQDAGPQTGAEAQIKYATLEGLFSEFAAVPNGDGVYLRASDNAWYFARFESQCSALDQSAVLGFKNDVSKRIAPGTVVVVPNANGHSECRIAQFNHSDAPPRELRGRRANARMWSVPVTTAFASSSERPSTRDTAR